MNDPHDKGKYPQFPGGEAWVDQYDERLHPKPRFAWFIAFLVWLRDHVLASILIAAFSVVLTIYLTKWLQTNQEQAPAHASSRSAS